MFRMNENLLEYRGDEEGENTGVIEISPEAVSDEDRENLGLSIANAPEFTVVDADPSLDDEMIDARSGRWEREADLEQARREARAAYSSKERDVVDAEVVDDPAEAREDGFENSEAPYVDVEVVDDNGPESEANYAQVDVVPEDQEKEANMKNAAPGRWKREAKEEWIAGGGFFGGPAWDLTKKIFGGLLTGLVAVTAFLGGWIADMFEGFTELFTKKTQKK